VALAVSEECLALDPGVRQRVAVLCETLGLPTKWRLPSADKLVVAAARDKKVRAGSSNFVGLRAIGEPVWGMNVSAEQLTRALVVIRA
jgi:3-dehydroquinate synthetase